VLPCHYTVSPATRRVSVKVRRYPPKANPRTSAFDVRLFLDSAGLGRKVDKFRRKETVFAQGDPAKNVMYIQEGGVRLTVVHETGKEAVVAILGPGDFFGEGCLAGRSNCMTSARMAESRRGYSHLPRLRHSIQEGERVPQQAWPRGKLPGLA
jgi:CRP-like cAMP-binding protein